MPKEIKPVYEILVRDSGDVYQNIEEFRFEVETMVRSYGLSADVVAVRINHFPEVWASDDPMDLIE